MHHKSTTTSLHWRRSDMARGHATPYGKFQVGQLLLLLASVPAHAYDNDEFVAELEKCIETNARNVKGQPPNATCKRSVKQLPPGLSWLVLPSGRNLTEPPPIRALVLMTVSFPGLAPYRPYTVCHTLCLYHCRVISCVGRSMYAADGPRCISGALISATVKGRQRGTPMVPLAGGASDAMMLRTLWTCAQLYTHTSTERGWRIGEHPVECRCLQWDARLQ
jgi:hypothetical protein